MRLFIAIEPDREFTSALSLLQDRLRAQGVEGRFLIPSCLHLTLAYIGEWQEDVSRLLPRIQEPFPICLSGIGVFPRAKVLWAGVSKSESLNRLAALVRDTLDSAGVPYDHQPFSPHITLLRKPVIPSEEALTTVRVPRAIMLVREVCLYRSDSTENGARYTVIGKSGKHPGFNYI